MLTGKELGAAIRSAIEKKGVTQRQLAAVFGVKAPSVQDWINKGTPATRPASSGFFFVRVKFSEK